MNEDGRPRRWPVWVIGSGLIVGFAGCRPRTAQDQTRTHPAADHEMAFPVEHGNQYPSWSPDGKWIAFSSDRDGDFEIYLMSEDGTTVRQLTDNSTEDQLPSFTEDGESIWFLVGPMEHFQQPDNWYQVPVAGGQPRPTHRLPPNPNSVQSKDGRITVYALPDPSGPAGPHGGPAMIVLEAGTDRSPKRISPPGHAEEPRLSPDANWIVFEHRRPNDELVDSKLFIAPVDGSTPARELTPGSNPSWSPDGRLILFKSWDSTARQLVISTIRPDGTELRHLGSGVLPSWSPDGTRILYMTERGERWEIVTRDRTGGDERCLTCESSR